MTDNELKALVASIAVAQKELVEQQKRTDARIDAQIAASEARQAKIDEQLARTDAQIAAGQARQAKIDEQLTRTDAQIAAGQARQAKTDEQLAKTDAQLAKTDAQLAKTDAQLARTDAQLDRVSRKLERLGELVGNISNNQGDIAEEFFYRSFLKNPAIGSLRFDSVSRNLNNSKDKIEEEYDLVLINGDSIAVLEVKAKAHVKDLELMVTRKMPHFPLLFREFSHYRRYAGIATLTTNDALIAKARELGLYLLTQQGDHQVVVQEGRKID
jgi:septal ring factor EnvC (AmiA/AmiB activator)